MTTMPDGLKYIGDVMSNFDHEIEPGAEERLKTGDCYGDYPAWDFHGKVWFDGENFQCEVMRYHTHIGTIAEKTLEEIMTTASDLWGWE